MAQLGLVAQHRRSDRRRTRFGLRVEQQKALFDRAIACGEIAADTDTNAIVERAVGPLYFRYFVTRRPITKRFLQELVGAALRPAARLNVAPLPLTPFMGLQRLGGFGFREPAYRLQRGRTSTGIP